MMALQKDKSNPARYQNKQGKATKKCLWIISKSFWRRKPKAATI